MSKFSDRADGLAQGQLERPDFVTDDHLIFLDELREVGVTNMLGALTYIIDEFPALNESEASAVLGYWMKTFGERHKADV